MTNRETARKLVEETIGVPPVSTSFINEMLEDAITAALDEAEKRAYKAGYDFARLMEGASDEQ